MMSDNAEVVVVGGGVIGLSCAWRLAQRGLRVLLLEREACGSGASGAALGALMPAPATRRGPFQRLQRQSLREFRGFAQELRERSGVDVGYRSSGLIEVLHSADRRRQAESECAAARAEWPAVGDGPVMEVLTDGEARALAAEVEFAGHGARYCRATAHVDASLLVSALRMACVADGVDVREGVAVTEVVVDSGCARGVMVGGDFSSCHTVLVAAGAWTGEIGAVLAAIAPMRPVKGQALLLHAPGIGLTHIIKRRSIYLIPQGDDHVLVGATTEPESGFNVRSTARGVAELTAGALGLMPSLATGSVVRTWSGLRPESVTRQPVMGEVPGAAGLFVAAGHYKTGVGLSALTGLAMAELIVDGRSSVDLAVFSPTGPHE